MEIEDRLLGYVRKVEHLKALDAETRSLWDRAVGPLASSSDERVQSSGSQDRIGESVSRFADKLNEFYAAEDEAYEELNEIDRLIEEVEDPDAARVLVMLYIRGLPPTVVMRSLCISRATFYRWKKRGLKEISEKAKE